jgi:hypothetical protein
LARSRIDWNYLIHRARHGAKRILSLLVFAQSNDLPVPADAVRAIRRLAFEGSAGLARAAAG